MPDLVLEYPSLFGMKIHWFGMNNGSHGAKTMTTSPDLKKTGMAQKIDQQKTQTTTR